MLKKSTCGSWDAASTWECDWQELSCPTQLKELVPSRKASSLRDDTRRLTGPTERLTKFKSKMEGVYPIKAKITSHGSPERIKNAEQKVALATAKKLCINTIPYMLMCLWRSSGLCVETSL